MKERDLVNAIRQEYCGLRDLPRDSLASGVKTLADDLYAKDTHFIFELIQNAEDNDYGPGILPRLAFEISLQEIEGKSGPVLIVRNNEIGFQENHVKALCQVGKSTKKKAQGYIGEKGIGFKSVFRVTRCPYIFSNGFQFCLPDHDEETGLGYIVPRWVPDLPISSRRAETTIALPLDREDSNVETIAEALRDFAPETILFIQKLNSIQVSVHLPNNECKVKVEKHVLADLGESKLVELTYLRRIGDEEILKSSCYWLTESEFPKPADVRHEKRTGIESRSVSVAIPLERESDGPKGKLFAYLPVWEKTGLPFLINADFVLVSSRESIHEDEPWNKWLRTCAEETYFRSFLALLNCHGVDLEKRSLAYGSIPLVSHQPFLSPLIHNIQGRLAGRECVMALPDNTLVAPSNARLSNQSLRKVLGPADRFPRYLHGEVRLVRPEVEKPFVEQLKAIGVSQITLPEVVRVLQDRAWVQGHELTWYLDLYGYLNSHKIDAATLRSLAIIPIVQYRRELPLLSCDKEQPVYFSCSEADQNALASVPNWLSELVSVVFLDADFLSLLDSHEDGKGLRKWMTEFLNVHEFSIESYCIDVLSKITKEYHTLADSQLVETTAFLAQHAGPKFDWEILPIIPADGQRVLLQDARKQTFRPLAQDFEDFDVVVQAVVVPENYNLASGWQHIWQSQEDRQHFVWLSEVYDQAHLAKLVEIGSITEYPLPEKRVSENTPQSVTKVNEDYRAPRTMPTNSASLVRWLQVKANIKTEWPKDTGRWNFQGEKSDIEWACRKKYYTQDEITYTQKTGAYQFQCDRSSFLEWLRNTSWLPTGKGPVPPPQAFLRKDEIMEVLGDDGVPYFEGSLPESILRLLGIQTEVTTAALLDLLSELSAGNTGSVSLADRIYSQLESRVHGDTQVLRARFSNEALILVAASNDTVRWCKSGECVWEDASGVLGDGIVYLKNQYPKLQDFFVDRLGVKRHVDPESFAQRWLKLQEDRVEDTGRRQILVAQLYREIRPIAQMDAASRPPWWCKFSASVKVYTQSDRFEHPTEVVLPDDGELRDIFRGNHLEFAWRPEKDAFNDWAHFYLALGTSLLSESVTERLVEEPEFAILPNRQFVTEASIKMIAAWLREKRRNDYDRLLKEDVFARLALLREAQTSSTIKVQFQLKVHSIDETRTEIYPVFWKREENTLIYGAEPRKDQIARTIAKGLVPGQAYKDLAHWIELVLEASDTTRLKHEGWSVPEEISNLLATRVHGSVTSQSPGDMENPIDPTDFGNPILDPVQPSSTGFQYPGGPSSYPPKTKDKPNPGPETQSGNVARGGTDETPEVIYQELLEAAFNRPGRTSIQNDENFKYDDDWGHGVKDPERRSGKLAEGYREDISNEPSPKDHRRLTERALLEEPNEQVRVSLYEWYGGKCQLCGETWPERDGQPYFAAAYLVERRHARWLDNHGNAICLCAKHFAQWCHAAIGMPLSIPDQIGSLRLRNEGGNGDLSIDFTLLGTDVSITYDERHFLALRTLLEVASEPHEFQADE